MVAVGDSVWGWWVKVVEVVGGGGGGGAWAWVLVGGG